MAVKHMKIYSTLFIIRETQIKATSHQSDSVQSLSHVRFFVTPWTAAHEASLSNTNFWSLLKLICSKSVMPSNHLILCHPLLLLLSIFPSIRFFFNESVLCIRWPVIIAIILKKLQTINAGKSVEQREPSCPVGGNMN